MNHTELLIECLKQGSVFHCSPHFCRRTESIFVLPVGKDLPFYHRSIHLPFFPDQNTDINSSQNKCDRYKSNQAMTESDECISHLRLVSPFPSQAEEAVNYFN